MPWRYAGASRFCPLCHAVRRLVVVSWLHGWERCEYCLLKLPVSSKNNLILLPRLV